MINFFIPPEIYQMIYEIVGESNETVSIQFSESGDWTKVTNKPTIYISEINETICVNKSIDTSQVTSLTIERLSIPKPPPRQTPFATITQTPSESPSASPSQSPTESPSPSPSQSPTATPVATPQPIQQDNQTVHNSLNVTLDNLNNATLVQEKIAQIINQKQSGSGSSETNDTLVLLGIDNTDTLDWCSTDSTTHFIGFESDIKPTINLVGGNLGLDLDKVEEAKIIIPPADIKDGEMKSTVNLALRGGSSKQEDDTLQTSTINLTKHASNSNVTAIEIPTKSEISNKLVFNTDVSKLEINEFKLYPGAELKVESSGQQNQVDTSIKTLSTGSGDKPLKVTAPTLVVENLNIYQNNQIEFQNLNLEKSNVEFKLDYFDKHRPATITISSNLNGVPNNISIVSAQSFNDSSIQKDNKYKLIDGSFSMDDCQKLKKTVNFDPTWTIALEAECENKKNSIIGLSGSTTTLFMRQSIPPPPKDEEEKNKNKLSTPIIIGIAVGGVVVVVAIIIVLVLVIKRSKKEKNSSHSDGDVKSDGSVNENEFL